MTVKQQQSMLVVLGYDLVVDGLTGPATRGAVQNFQRARGLDADGIFGHDTEQEARACVASCWIRPEEQPAPDPVAHDQPVPGAAASAQQYLQSDGFYHIHRGVNVQLSDHLWSYEVACQGSGCCTESVVDPLMVDLFEEIRVDYAAPISIGTAGGSGYRCPVHNSAPDVGGAAGSLHLTGSAFDMHADVGRLLPVVLRHLKDGEYGVYSDFIHVGRWHRGYVNRFK